MTIHSAVGMLSIRLSKLICRIKFSFFTRWLLQQAKLSRMGLIEPRSDCGKDIVTDKSDCLVRIIVWRCYWVVFFKWCRKNRYSEFRALRLWLYGNRVPLVCNWRLWTGKYAVLTWRWHKRHNTTDFGFNAWEVSRTSNFTSCRCQLATKIMRFDAVRLFRGATS